MTDKKITQETLDAKAILLEELRDRNRRSQALMEQYELSKQKLDADILALVKDLIKQQELAFEADKHPDLASDYLEQMRCHAGKLNEPIHKSENPINTRYANASIAAGLQENMAKVIQNIDASEELKKKILDYLIIRRPGESLKDDASIQKLIDEIIEAKYSELRDEIDA